jgi:hypothetical protein
MSKKQTYATAHEVIDHLAADHQPGPAVEDTAAWRRTVRNRLRTQHWTLVVATLEASPDMDPLELADTIRAAHPTAAPTPANPGPPAIEPWTGPEYDPDDGPVVDDPDDVRAHLDRARAALDAASKPPPGEPPPSRRGAVP